MKLGISIIVPVYNVSKYLKRGINSLINQKNFEELEIILINDGSIDDSKLICEYYVSKYSNIKLINKINGGVSSARNIGIDYAKKKYLCFFDPDDIVESDYYFRLYNLIEFYKTDLVSVDFYTNFSDKLKKKKKNCEILYSSQYDIKKAFLKGGILSNNLFDKIYKTQLCKNIRFNEEISIGEDMLFLYSYICLIKNAYINTNYCGYIYYKNEDSAMNKQFSLKFLDALKASSIISNLEKNTQLNCYSYAHEYHERCKLLEYILLNNGLPKYKKIWDENYNLLKSYPIFKQKKYHSIKQYLGILLMLVSPKLYLKIHKLMRVG